MIRRVQDPHDVDSLFGFDAGQSYPAPDEWLQPNYLGLVAVNDEGLSVGGILLAPDKRLAARVISFRMASLYVAESSRRKGIAHALLKAASKEAAGMGVTRIHVIVHPSNRDGVALFDSLGPTQGAAYVICLTHRACQG